MIAKSKKTLERRQSCYLSGTSVEGKVVRQGKAFNIFSSSSNYTITVEVGGQNIEITYKSENLWKSCKIGDKLIGLKNNTDYFFGPEIGCIFKFFETK